jgi:hypothetical protein
LALKGAGTAAAVSASTWLARRPGPVLLLDESLLVLRRAAPAQLVRGWSASAPLAVLVLSLYYLERIEGIHAPLAVYAVALTLAFAVRFALLSQLAREFVSAAQPSLPLTAAAPARSRLFSSAAVSGFGLWLWAWPFLLLGRISMFAVLAAVPIVALRGAVAPSFLARAACAPESGFSAWVRALEDNRGARAIMLGLELAVSLCLLVLFVNVYALGATVLLLANSVLGLDVSFVAAFLAPDNEFLLLLLLGLCWLALEPLRAAVSALAFSEARGRNEGADLHAAIDALDAGTAAPATRSGARTIAVCVFVLASASAAHAAPALVDRASAADEGVRRRVQQILRRGEFHEWSDDQGPHTWFADWLDRLFGQHSESDTNLPSAPRFSVRVPAALVIGLSLILLALVVWFVSSEARRAKGRPPIVTASGPPPPSASRPPPSPEQLARASELADAGAYDEAVRLLYGGTLALLARAALIFLERSRTNGHYVRALPAGPLREQLAQLTAMFERSWYGKQAATQADYVEAERCVQQLRAAAERAR